MCAHPIFPPPTQPRGGVDTVAHRQVNALATDLDLNRLDQLETGVINKAARRQGVGHLGNEPHAADEVAVARDLAGDAAAEVGRTVDACTQWFPIGARLYLRLGRTPSPTTV